MIALAVYGIGLASTLTALGLCLLDLIHNWNTEDR